MGLAGMPKAHHLYIAHSTKPSLDDLAYLIYEGDDEVSKIAQRRWQTRLREVCEEQDLMDYEIVSIMPVSWALKIMNME
jgi:hypothetical protein